MEYNDKRLFLREIRTKMRKLYMGMIEYQFIPYNQDENLKDRILILSAELRDYQQICPDIWMHINFSKSVYRDAYFDLLDRYPNYEERISNAKSKPEEYIKENIANRKFIRDFLDKYDKYKNPEYLAILPRNLNLDRLSTMNSLMDNLNRKN